MGFFELATLLFPNIDSNDKADFFNGWFFSFDRCILIWTVLWGSMLFSQFRSLNNARKVLKRNFRKLL